VRGYPYDLVYRLEADYFQLSRLLINAAVRDIGRSRGDADDYSGQRIRLTPADIAPLPSTTQ